MTIESTRATTAPDLPKRLREHDDPRLYHEADVLMSEAADEIERLSQPSPSTGGEPDLTGQDIEAAEQQAALYEGDDRECIKTDVMNSFYAGVAYERKRVAGGEPATDSAGRVSIDTPHFRLLLSDMTLAHKADPYGDDFQARMTRIMRHVDDQLAAREPAPAARELDVEAELLDAAKAFYNATVADVEVLIRTNSAAKRDAVNAAGDRLRAAMLASTSSQATAESALASAAPDEQQGQIPEGWREQMQSIIKWLHDSVQTAGNTPEDHGYASEFDYNLSHAANTIESMLKDIGVLIAPSNTSPVGAKEQDK